MNKNIKSIKLQINNQVFFSTDIVNQKNYIGNSKGIIAKLRETTTDFEPFTVEKNDIEVEAFLTLEESKNDISVILIFNQPYTLKSVIENRKKREKKIMELKNDNIDETTENDEISIKKRKKATITKKQ